jgi:hypothetical protein
MDGWFAVPVGDSRSSSSGRVGDRPFALTGRMNTPIICHLRRARREGRITRSVYSGGTDQSPVPFVVLFEYGGLIP